MRANSANCWELYVTKRPPTGGLLGFREGMYRGVII